MTIDYYVLLVLDLLYNVNILFKYGHIAESNYLFLSRIMYHSCYIYLNISTGMFCLQAKLLENSHAWLGASTSSIAGQLKILIIYI